jgi:DNA mismatch endonuclease (patch repair protein)
MADVLTPEQRRLNMSRIRGKDTIPELVLRRGLHARGLRFRLHRKDLPGRPDIVFPRYRAAVLVHGCFWHGHDCPLFKWPATRREFWQAKIEGNRARDLRNLAGLAAAGWRVLVVWECALKGPARLPADAVLAEIAAWLASSSTTGSLHGG